MTCFPLAPVSAKRVSELHGLLYSQAFRRMNSCIFSFVPGFVAKTQNPALLDTCFDEFTIPSLKDVVDED